MHTLEHSRLGFRWYRLRLYRFLFWSRRERRSLRLRSFLHQLDRLFPPASPNKLAVGGAGHSLGKKSVLLGRATAVGVDGSPGLGGGKGVGVGASGGGGSGSVPRRNSLGDLKILARISEPQVGLRRGLRVVKEFALNIERYFFSLSLTAPMKALIYMIL